MTAHLLMLSSLLPSVVFAEPAPVHPRPAPVELTTMVGLLVQIDGGQHPAAEYAGLLHLLHLRFPDHSVTRLGDLAAKAKEVCSTEAQRHVEVIAPLYALKNITDGYEGAAFEQMFKNNPPPTLLTLWIASGCE